MSKTYKIVNAIMLLLFPVFLLLFIGLAVKNYITIKYRKRKLK